MDEQNIVELYQEMMASIATIEESGVVIDAGRQLQIDQFRDIANDLLTVANEAGFGDRMLLNNNITIDPKDDFEQIIDSFKAGISFKKEILDAFVKLANNDAGGKKVLWDSMKIIDEYYQANVTDVDHISVTARMKGQWEVVFGSKEEVQNMNVLAVAYQQACQEALEAEIQNLVKNKGVVSTDRLHNGFVKNLKDKKNWISAGDKAQSAIVQLKVDFYQYGKKLSIIFHPFGGTRQQAR